MLLCILINEYYVTMVNNTSTISSISDVITKALIWDHIELLNSASKSIGYQSQTELKHASSVIFYTQYVYTGESFLKNLN